MVILCDLSEVLVGGDKMAANIVTSRYGKDTSLRCLNRLEEVRVEYQALLKGELHEDAFWAEFFRHGIWPFGAKEAKSILSEAITHEIPGTLDVLTSITAFPEAIQKGMPHYRHVMDISNRPPEVYIVSDYCNERVNEARSCHPDLFQFVTDEYWSCDLGYTKDEEAFFTSILRDLCLEPNEAIYIDDSYAKTKVAERCGITSIKFENATQLRTILHETYGFEFLDAE